MKQSVRLIILLSTIAVLAGILIIVLCFFFKGCDIKEKDAVEIEETQKEDHSTVPAEKELKTPPTGEKKVIAVVKEKPKAAEIVKKGFFEEFNEQVIDKRWQWIREKPASWSLSKRPGFLTITTESGSLWGTGYNNTRNLLLTEVEFPDFQLDAKIEIHATQDWHNAGIIVYKNDDEYVALYSVYDTTTGGKVIHFNDESKGSPHHIRVISYLANIVFLRIIKNGPKYSSFMSSDGKDFTFIGEVSHDLGEKPKVGITVDKGGSQGIPNIPAYIDYFHILYN
jgi:regulation of enolase protein 1 (concanavalin A-like superfamily)